MADSKSRMENLIGQLNAASKLYYTGGQTTMSDAQWDRLYNELAALENETGIRRADSPTRRVGAEPLKAFQPHRHISRLWSMDKVQSKADLQTWLARTQKLYAQYKEQYRRCRRCNSAWNTSWTG